VSCFGVFIALLFEKFHTQEYQAIKGAMFGILGFSNSLGMIHALYLSRYSEPGNCYIPFGKIFYGIFSMGFLYLFGLILYIFRIPERFSKRRFDIWCNSHTLFHVFVVLAAVNFLITMKWLYFERRDRMICG